MCKKEDEEYNLGVTHVDSDDSDEYIDECEMQNFLDKDQKIVKQYTNNINFQLPNSNGLIITLQSYPETTAT